jgi:uncharacterized protein with von Willebrand factor type A (vWA) domain
MSYLFRYARWDGTQHIFDLDGDDLMDQMSDELMAHGDVHRALRDLLRRGVRNRDGESVEGMRQLMERLRGRRRENLERYNMDSMFDDIKERLQDVIDTERKGIDRRVQKTREQEAQGPDIDLEQAQKLLDMLEERANRSREQLDNLPESPGGAIKQLSEYEFMDPEAQRKFQELLDMLKEQMLQNQFQQMKQQLQGTTPDQMTGMGQMLRDLNQMLQDQAMGQQPDFQGFMEKYGNMFGDNSPKNLDELLDQVAHQIAQMQSLLDSMSPEMRQELEGLMDSLMDPETMDELAELAQTLEQMLPMNEMRNQYPFMGEESMTMEQAMELMGELQGMDNLERQIQDVMQNGNIDGLDLDQLEKILGEDTRRTVEELNKVAEMLEEAGYVKRTGDKLELTPKGIRKIGQKALREVFTHLKRDRMTQHELQLTGFVGEDSGETKVYEFGDPFDVDLQRSMLNAVTRGGPQVPVRMAPDDFEIRRREQLTQTATCLLLDQSRSMGMFGSFQAAKKVTMALYALIQGQFPRDKLYVIGFSDYAMELKGEDLPQTTWNAWMSGTNMQHAFMLSRKLLAQEKVGTRQIIMITDGEPTAHTEGSRAYFAYPPSLRTIQETLKEVRRCTQAGIIINTFMLESSYYLLDFVDKMTRINRGKAFYTTPDKLGEFILVDYLNNRKRRVA